MNRIQPLPTETQQAVSPPEPQAAVAAARYSPAGERAAFACFAPLHYEPNYAYPLLIWLHGDRDSERQLKRIMPLVSLRNYVAVAPRGSRELTLDDRTLYSWRQSEADVVLAEQRVSDCIAAARRKFHVRPDRVFLTGFDCGGTMAFRLALRQPERYAGVVSLCGSFPSGRAPLGRYAEARRLPLFLACGRDSASYPLEQVCRDLRLFHSAGMAVALRQYPCGQELASQMLCDLDRWIMDQIAPTSCTADSRGADL